MWKALPTSISNIADVSIWERPIEIVDIGVVKRNIHKSMDSASTWTYNNYLSAYSNIFSLDNSW